MKTIPFACITFIFSKQGIVKAVPINDEQKHKELKSLGYRQNATIDSANWIETYANSDEFTRGQMLDEFRFGTIHNEANS